MVFVPCLRAFAAVDVGPLTPYGETVAEKARKLELFEFYDLAFRQGQPERAFARYVSPKFKDYSHLLTHGGPPAGYRQKLAQVRRLLVRYRAGRFELPDQASIDNEMITAYGSTLDVYRIHDGKIVAHWDASPPAPITIPAHAPGTAERVMSGKGPAPPGLRMPKLTVADLTPPPGSNVLHGPVAVGPVSPYGETPAEAAAKKVTFECTQMAWVQGNFPAAARRYLSPRLRNYSHIDTQGKEAYVIEHYPSLNPPNYGAMKKMGIKLGLPKMATVDGDMVIMFGQGVDIDQVDNGRIVARWDASPPKTVTLEPPPEVPAPLRQ